MVYIIRGLPGSGKTTFVKQHEVTKNFLLLEGDQIMYDENGNYSFKNAKASREYVSVMLHQALKLGNTNIVITTAAQNEESLKGFIDVCRRFNVKYVITHVFTNESFESEHNLTKEIIDDMLDKWEPIAGERYIEITKDGPIMRDQPPAKYRMPRT